MKGALNGRSRTVQSGAFLRSPISLPSRIGTSSSNKLIIPRILFTVALALLIIATWNMGANAQTDATTPKLDLGIIVVPTIEDAQAVLKQLKSSEDFSILAKEKSTDPTATDGGYLGNLVPDELRPELRDAVRGLHVGDLSNIVHISSGFAILKVFPVAPPTSDLNPARISSLVSTGAIRIGPSVSGLTEANTAFVEYIRKSGVQDQSIQGMCDIRTESLATAKNTIKQAIANNSFRGAPAYRGGADSRAQHPGAALWL